MKLQVTLLCFSLLPYLKATTFHHRASYNALHGLMKRRDCGRGDTCAEACGPGYEQCVSPDLCYNPTVGDQCCSNGGYCPKGEYCAKTSSGASVCCTDGVSLADCGAVATVATLPPAAATTAAPTTAAGTGPAKTTAGSVTPVSYANTTFTKGTTTGAGSTAAGSTAAGPGAPGPSTAFSTTTIPLPGGGFVTSTAFTAVPTSGSSSAPTILQASGGEDVSPRGIYWVVWSALMLGLGAILA